MDEGSEDAILYSIYPDVLPLDEAEVLDHLERLRVECLAVAAPLVQGYIWQHNQFDLQPALSAPPSHKEPAFSMFDEFGELHEAPPPPSAAPSPGLPLLYGRTRYGHNLEDEWFVVYLLLEISRRIPQVSVKVWDTDGEFLLIEAAYAIPRWLKPENSYNRVFIRQGAMHILPLPTSPAQLGYSLANPSLADALRILASGCVETRAAETVQAVIARKLAEYPGRALQNMHKVRCKVPFRVAQVLKHEPQMVCLVVEAFYTRDHDAMAAASKMEKFVSRGGDGDPEMVTVLVCMSKAMFAQLKQQVFQAPRKYPMQGHGEEDDIGMKLTCGFEMMYWECSRYQDEEQENTKSLAGDAGWQAFRKSLEATGYFRGLLEGSKEHRELMKSAVSRYRQTETFSRIRASMQAPAQRVDEILALEHRPEDFRNLELPRSDDDSWLYKGDEELTSAMQERQKEMDEFEKQRSGGDRHSREDFDPSQLTKTMKSFVDKISSFEGAEVPSDNRAVSLDMGKFLHELQTALEMEGAGVEGFESASSSDMDVSDDDESDIDPKGKGLIHENDDFMEEYTEAIERELHKSTISKTFVRGNEAPATASSADVPVNVDLNLVKNMLESYSSQQGLPGPASNLLGMMGLHLPDDSEAASAQRKQ